MLEEGIDVALFGGLRQRVCDLLERGFGVIGFPEAIVGEAGGVHFRHLQVIAFGDAESGVVFAHEAEDGIVEPALIAELDGRQSVWRNALQERSQAIGVGFQEWRELKEDRAEFVGGRQGPERLIETVDVGGDIFQALDVGDALMGFDGEAESFRSGFGPILLRFWARDGRGKCNSPRRS